MSAPTIPAFTTALTAHRPFNRSRAWWGMVLFIAGEATLFACIIGSYYYVRFRVQGDWPLSGAPTPALTVPWWMTGVLVSSAPVMAYAGKSVRRGHRRRYTTALLVLLVLSLAYLSLHGLDLHDELANDRPQTDIYGSLFYSTSALEGAHQAIATLMVIYLLAIRRHLDPQHTQRQQLVAMYWYFAVVVWIAVLFAVYLGPRL